MIVLVAITFLFLVFRIKVKQSLSLSLFFISVITQQSKLLQTNRLYYNYYQPVSCLFFFLPPSLRIFIITLHYYSSQQ